MRDEWFIRGKIPMTKSEVRSVSVSKLELEPDHIVYDIGAGTGSVSVEMALHVPNGHVYAFEQKEEGCELIRKNAEKATGKTGCGKRIGMARLRACMMYRVSVRMDRPVASAAAIPAQPAGREENVAAVSDRPVGGAFNGRKALVHRCTRLTCHSEERSDVGISQYLAG